jgi:predicted membrane protein
VKKLHEKFSRKNFREKKMNKKFFWNKNDFAKKNFSMKNSAKKFPRKKANQKFFWNKNKFAKKIPRKFSA